MSNCSDHKNPLHNNGTSQPQRLLPGMDKSQFALVDEKGFADWIVFAKEFSAFIKYYNQFNQNIEVNNIRENWQPFFSSDVSAQLGTIAIQNIVRYRTEIKERFDFIKDDENETSISEIRIKLNELFSALLTLSAALDNYLLKLPGETPLKNTILNLVQTKLAPALTRLIGYYNAAKSSTLDFLDSSALSNWIILNKPLTDTEKIITDAGLSNNWYDDSLFPDFKTSANNIQADDSIFKNPLNTTSDKFLSIGHAANHNLFTGIFDTYLAAYTKIIREAEAGLLNTLEKYDNHAPHYALFLSFLMLYRFTQDNINTITQRHLDFYYKEVLRLQPKPAEANKVHVLGELAKQVDSYLLVQNTALKAGKDSLKKEVFYTLDSDVVFTKAKVSQLKTFYKASDGDTLKDPDTGTVIQINAGRVFASPISNSDDGLTPALTSPSKEWQPFVHKQYKDAELEKIAMPKAELGFALASHYLYLTEGVRNVFIRFVLSEYPDAFNEKNLECYLTAEKEWFKVDSVTISLNKTLSDHDTHCAEISFVIPGSAPPIVNYDASKHGGSFNLALPMMKIVLINENKTVYEYDSLKDITLSKVEIRVEVGNDSVYNQNGIKNLILSNDFGDIDASKPFMPFGGQPEKDNSLVIGHKEIFSKKNAEVKLNVEWAALPDVASKIMYETNAANDTTPACIPQILTDGKWLDNADENIIPASEALFSGITSQFILFSGGQSIPDNAVSDYEEEYDPLNAATLNGFLKLSLDSSFGYKDYIRDMSLYLIEKTLATKTITVPPVEPYTPKIKSLYAGYDAYCINDVSNKSLFEEREIFFFHLYPFGDCEQNLSPDSTETKIHLLPQFNHNSNGVTLQHIGEFYIGIEYLNPDESVNILFQVMEGSSNPTVVKPAHQISWSYLSENHWIDFKASDVSDNTLDLVQSGIISFAIPADATALNTILPAGYTWLKASVTEAAEAVCALITVDAQAAVSTFFNNNNAPDFLNKPLPAGTISKLAIPDAAIKKIVQPYSSFGGRATESDGQFYIRVSERLRHKNRAITVWDYEHLVLEAFPEIYKVKCLNHTQIDDGVYHEVRPGYVSIITIPSQINRNDANPLKPYTQQSTLTNIENFLRKRISCFVQLRASQPQFEEVRLDFSLKLYDSYKDFTFYANLLKDEITKFLSPWAYGNTSTIDFGGKVYKSVLINFIEERYYVDFITDVSMYVKVDDTTNESGNMEEITASTARSILVSAPASKHLIHEIVPEDLSVIQICIDKNNQ